MMILHISKRRIAVMAVSFMVIAAVTVVLAGCFSDKENTITLADTAEMADYLQQLGWQVEPDPIETLDLQLPQTLGDTWGDYAAMQTLCRLCGTADTALHIPHHQLSRNGRGRAGQPVPVR